VSTRGCIARVHGDGFRGVYHHFDAYPQALGKKLFDLAQTRDLSDMARELIDDHPAGWIALGERCICHGEDPEGPMVVTDQENSDWVQWAYAFDEATRTMGVFRHLASRQWRLCEVVPLDGPEPDWNLIEAIARRMGN